MTQEKLPHRKELCLQSERIPLCVRDSLFVEGLIVTGFTAVKTGVKGIEVL